MVQLHTATGHSWRQPIDNTASHLRNASPLEVECLSFSFPCLQQREVDWNGVGHGENENGTGTCIYEEIGSALTCVNPIP